MLSAEAVEQKRKQEQEIMTLMVQVYCRGKHKQKKVLCEDCQELLQYALIRTQKCPFMATKTFCSACTVHCYSPAMRQKVKEVMGYAGPRMLFYHPIIALRHCFVTWKETRKNKKSNKIER